MKTLKKIEKILIKSMNNLDDFVGRPQVFASAVLLICAWFAVGLFLEYDTWFDIMDVFIFVTTFFLLFVVQSSQNADTKAMQDKLDEIIDSLPKASKKKEHEEDLYKKGEKK
ncbi:MAG: hypothetical protein B7Z19_03955 [Polynucleobacter sp. 32-46-5]|nr:MAG: hypothetical protein B7Z19_03955 [Polynucleobacter sp. 32-46-5]